MLGIPPNGSKFLYKYHFGLCRHPGNSEIKMIWNLFEKATLDSDENTKQSVFVRPMSSLLRFSHLETLLHRECLWYKNQRHSRPYLRLLTWHWAMNQSRLAWRQPWLDSRTQLPLRHKGERIQTNIISAIWTDCSHCLGDVTKCVTVHPVRQDC